MPARHETRARSTLARRRRQVRPRTGSLSMVATGLSGRYHSVQRPATLVARCRFRRRATATALVPSVRPAPIDEPASTVACVVSLRAYTAVVGIVVATTGTIPAGAETTYRATVSPATVDFPRTRELTFRLEIATGDRPERVTLEPRELSWPRPHALSQRALPSKWVSRGSREPAGSASRACSPSTTRRVSASAAPTRTRRGATGSSSLRGRARRSL